MMPTPHTTGLDANPLPPIVASLLPDDVRWGETGLLPAANASSPLPIEIPAWTHNWFPGSSSSIRVYWDNTLIYEKKWTDEHIPPVDLFFDMPSNNLTPGLHELWYELTLSNGDIQDSDRLIVTIDLTPPVLGANQGQLIFDTAAVTEQYLKDNGDELLGRVPIYGLGNAGDVITWYWNTDPFTVVAADIVSSRTLYREDIGQPLSVLFSGDMIRSRGDGDRYAFYQLADRAGNKTAYSLAVRLATQAQPVSRFLPSPRVAEASGSSTQSVLLAYDARAGATVVIPDDAVFKPGDVTTVQWAVPGTEGAYLATTPQSGGLRFSIPNTHIAQHMGKDIPVYYQVAGEDPAQSENHTLTVRPLEAARFRTIQCTQPVGVVNRLSLSSVVGQATFRLGRWMFMGPGQLVTVTLTGVGPDQVVLDNYRVVEADVTTEWVEAHAPKAVLELFRVNESLTVRVKVSFDGGTSRFDFPSLNLTLVA
jgi:hypothetical protein